MSFALTITDAVSGMPVTSHNLQIHVDNYIATIRSNDQPHTGRRERRPLDTNWTCGKYLDSRAAKINE